VSIDTLFKFFAINILLEDSNTIDETQILLSKNEFRNKKRTKKEDKNKRKRDKIDIAKAILKTKRRKTLNKKIDRNKHNLIKQ